MNSRNRLISPCATLINKELVPDIPAVLRRLLLFDTYILQSIRFAETVPLVRVLGVNSVIRLLNSGALMLELDPNQITQFDQSAEFIRNRPPLPLGSFSFSVILVQEGKYDQYLLRSIEEVHRLLYGFVSQSDLRKLETAILRALLPRPNEPTKIPALNDLIKELRGESPVIRRSVLLKLKKAKSLDISDSDLKLRIIPLDESDFSAETNLDRFGLDAEQSHKMLESAFLAIGSLSSRIEEMMQYEALSGCMDRDLSLFTEKFDLLSETLSPRYRLQQAPTSPDEREDTFTRILKLKHLPTFELNPPDRSFDMEQFLEIRASKEAVEFRTWFREMNSSTDEEIRQQVHTLRVRLGPFVHGNIGRGIRLAVSTAVGLIPFAGTVLGAGLSVIDSYLLEKIFPVSGPTLFLSSKYPSLFESTNINSHSEQEECA